MKQKRAVRPSYEEEKLPVGTGGFLSGRFRPPSRSDYVMFRFFGRLRDSNQMQAINSSEGSTSVPTEGRHQER